MQRKKVNKMSICLSKKDLKSLATSLNAVYITNNCYIYENIVHSSRNIIDYFNMDDVIDLEKPYVVSYQVAYSAGICGNSGQLHKIVYYDVIDEVRKTIFAYYVK